MEKATDKTSGSVNVAMKMEKGEKMENEKEQLIASHSNILFQKDFVFKMYADNTNGLLGLSMKFVNKFCGP